jgi:hypothetical protein
MLHPGLAYLLKAIVVTRPAAHAIEVLRYDWMVGLWHCKNIHGHVSDIANCRHHTQPDLGPATSILGETWVVWKCRSRRSHISGNDIGPRVKPFGRTLRRSKREQKQRQREVTQYSLKHRGARTMVCFKKS